MTSTETTSKLRSVSHELAIASRSVRWPGIDVLSGLGLSMPFPCGLDVTGFVRTHLDHAIKIRSFADRSSVLIRRDCMVESTHARGNLAGSKRGRIYGLLFDCPALFFHCCCRFIAVQNRGIAR